MNIKSFRVVPTLPEMLKPVMELAYNQWYCWNQRGLRLFRHIDRKLWDEVYHNPVEMLSKLSQSRVLELLEDAGFLSQMKRTYEEFKDYTSDKDPYSFLLSQPIDFTIGYFSMEFGITESLPIYSGGLGILAGDHLKSASDLRMPLKGIGLMYKQGYFNQYLNVDGWQQEGTPDNDFYHMSLILEKDNEGQPIKISLKIGERDCAVQIWRCQVGRLPLYLLDTNLAENHPDDRKITAQLYGGGHTDDYRLKQEIVLGIGGVRALHALGQTPSVYHMNEGHSFLVALERIRDYVLKEGLDFQTALAIVKSSMVFTTHTPIPVGNDEFNVGLFEKYIRPYVNDLKINWNDFISLGRKKPSDGYENFGATVFAIKTSEFRNGVSKLHGQVSRGLWKDIWPHVNAGDIPISSITNGIHIPSWISADMADLFDRYMGPRWKEDPDNLKTWERIDEIPDSELWSTHERRKERLVAFARNRLIKQLKARGAKIKEIERAREVLNPNALTIGFAKRFAGYKRGNLIFRDLNRIKRILANKEHPVQLIISGKAHPRDNEGKSIIQQISHITREEPFRDRVVFIEDYNMNIARYLVEGVDIWLNNPKRPLEACGTSGMKATANGAINLSVLDGWWVEGYRPDLGWSIGMGEEYENAEYQDDIESKTLYDLLEREIIPLFFDRGLDGLPRNWISMMKRSMRQLCPEFNSNRMVEEYTDRCYKEAALNYKIFSGNDYKAAKDLVGWENKLRQNWNEIKVLDMHHEEGNEINVDTQLIVKARIQLGSIEPDQVSPRVYYGLLDDSGDLINPRDLIMEHEKNMGHGTHLFVARLQCEDTGKFGYTLRVLPRHENCKHPVDLGLITWA